jgi:hypothetical protein
MHRLEEVEKEIEEVVEEKKEYLTKNINSLNMMDFKNNKHL